MPWATSLARAPTPKSQNSYRWNQERKLSRMRGRVSYGRKLSGQNLPCPKPRSLPRQTKTACFCKWFSRGTIGLSFGSGLASLGLFVLKIYLALHRRTREDSNIRFSVKDLNACKYSGKRSIDFLSSLMDSPHCQLCSTYLLLWLSFLTT